MFHSSSSSPKPHPVKLNPYQDAIRGAPEAAMERMVRMMPEPMRLESGGSWGSAEDDM